MGNAAHELGIRRMPYRVAPSMNRAWNAQYKQLAGLEEVLRVAKGYLDGGEA